MDHIDQIRDRLIGRGDRLLLLRSRCDRETYHLGDRDLSTASDALDPLSGLRVNSQSQRRSHIANTHESGVLRRVIQENCGRTIDGRLNDVDFAQFNHSSACWKLSRAPLRFTAEQEACCEGKEPRLCEEECLRHW